VAIPAIRHIAHERLLSIAIAGSNSGSVQQFGVNAQKVIDSSHLAFSHPHGA